MRKRECVVQVATIVAKAKRDGRSPLSALADVADAAGCADAGENLDYCGGWIKDHGEPTWDKLLSWAVGVDDGAESAARQLAHKPSVAPVRVGEAYGLIRLEHRQTGDAYLIPWTDRTMGEARAMGDSLKKLVDPRSGQWVEESLTFCHV